MTFSLVLVSHPTLPTILRPFPCVSMLFHNDNAQKEATRIIVQENTYLGEAQFAEDVLDNLQWISGRSGPPADKPHSSLILFFTEPSSANLAIEHGIAFSGRLLRAQQHHSLHQWNVKCISIS